MDGGRVERNSRRERKRKRGREKLAENIGSFRYSDDMMKEQRAQINSRP
jgi:hypothetical protein